MEAMQAFLERQTALLQRMYDMLRRHISMSDAVLERLSVGSSGVKVPRVPRGWVLRALVRRNVRIGFVQRVLSRLFHVDIRGCRHRGQVRLLGWRKDSQLRYRRPRVTSGGLMRECVTT